MLTVRVVYIRFGDERAGQRFCLLLLFFISCFQFCYSFLKNSSPFHPHLATFLCPLEAEFQMASHTGCPDSRSTNYCRQQLSCTADNDADADPTAWCQTCDPRMVSVFWGFPLRWQVCDGQCALFTPSLVMGEHSKIPCLR